MYGSGYASNSVHGAGNGHGGQESEEEQSDFKTTTLRFTNNNFIEDRRRDRSHNVGERDSSYGPIAGQQN